MKNVLYISPGMGRNGCKGGVSLCVRNYSLHIADFKVLVTRKRGNSKLINAFYFPFLILRVIYKLLTDRAVKIVHIHGSIGGSFFRKYMIYKIVRLFSKKKVIFHVHSGGIKKFYNGSNATVKKWIRDIINNSDMVICLSESWKKYFTETFSPRKLEVVNNMILPPKNTGRIDADNRFTLLFLGLITENKGIFDLLKVIADNREEYNGKLLLRVGGNGKTKQLEEVIAELHLENMVTFEGWVSGEHKEQLYRSSDVLILPSYFEGVPLVILEAMSYGLPIIATNVGGIPDILERWNNGILLEPGDAVQLNNAILKLMNDKGLQSQFSECSQKGISNFYPDSVLEKLQKIYQEME